jgi:hypothetical protein
MPDNATDTMPGWDAIDAALAARYGDQEPHHYGTMISWRLGGPDPLDGVSVYDRAEPVPHWHFVTYGMSELYEKESEVADESGWGLEFTFRLARAPGAGDNPPTWALNFLQNLARYVFASGNVFSAGHHMNLNGPISLDRPDTGIHAVLFATDPELGEIDTPHGRVRFLQVVGVTLDELDAATRWSADDLLEVLRQRLPLLVTDLDRPSVLSDPATSAEVEAAVARDGSSTGSLYVQLAGWDLTGGSVEVTFGAIAAERIGRLLAARLPHGRPVFVEAPEGGVVFRPGPAFAAEAGAEPGWLELTTPPALADELAAVLVPRAGAYTLASTPALTVHIRRSEIRNPEGDVVEVVG